MSAPQETETQDSAPPTEQVEKVEPDSVPSENIEPTESFVVVKPSDVESSEPKELTESDPEPAESNPEKEQTESDQKEPEPQTEPQAEPQPETQLEPETEKEKDKQVDATKMDEVVLETEAKETPYQASLNTGVYGSVLQETGSADYDEKQMQNEDDWNLPWKSDEEKDMVKQFGQILADKHGIRDVSPLELARFVLGSKCRLEKAEERFLKLQALSAEYKFDSISDEQVDDALQKFDKWIQVGGHDSQDRLLFGMCVREFSPSDYAKPVLLKAFLTYLNKYTKDLEVCRTGVMFVADMESFGWKNFSLDFEKLFMNVIQETYPLRVGPMYFVQAPFLLRTVLTILRPFLSEKMRERVNILKTWPVLYEKVKQDQIPSICGNGTFQQNRAPTL